MFGVSLTGSLEVFLSTAMRLQAVVVECLGVFWEVRSYKHAVCLCCFRLFSRLGLEMHFAFNRQMACNKD